MRKAKYKIGWVFFITLLIASGLLITEAFATASEYGAMKELEAKERLASPDITIVRPNVEYGAGGLRDPFKSPIEEAAKRTEGEQASLPENPPALAIQGIIWGGNFPQAIINNKVVKVEDTIEGARIVSISKEGVTVFFEGRQYKLSSPGAGTLSGKKP